MRKVTPDPPEVDDTASHQSPHFQNCDDATHHEFSGDTPSLSDIRATPRTPSRLFIVNPEVDVQALLGISSEGLASACVIIMDQADRETGAIRNTLLGVHMIISAIELSVNRALDQLDSKQ